MDPCDDFYSYACGGFFKSHQLNANQSSTGGFTILNNDNMEVLRQAMETAALNYSQVWHDVGLSERTLFSRVRLNRPFARSHGTE